MAHVAVTRPLPEAGLAPLRATHEVHVNDEKSGGLPMTETGVVELAQGAEALISTVADPLPASVLEQCTHLRVLAQFGVGVDNIDVAAARELGLMVTHTPGVLTDATADFAFALLLAVARRLRAADQFVRDGRFEGWETTLLLGMELTGKTLGIVGMGRIGQAMARRAIGFGMDVIYHNRHPANPTVERRLSAQFVSLETLLAESDVVSLHCALNDDSRHLINADALQQMKPTALLVNTARGPVVDEGALVEALAAGEIAGAGLDVFEREPEVHSGLLEQERVVLAPHLASATVEARTKMAQMCSEAVLATFSGGEVPYRVT